MRLIVFTDLDGTLLDHGDYSYSAALPALQALRAQGIPLILASSKTGAEIAPLHHALGLGEWPIIVENGAQRVIPGADMDDRSIYERLRGALDELPAELRTCYRGFGDMTDAEVAAQLAGIYGVPTDGWQLLRRDDIPYALPAQPAPLLVREALEVEPGLIMAGDHLDTGSIQGAMVSGQRAAEGYLHRRTGGMARQG